MMVNLKNRSRILKGAAIVAVLLLAAVIVFILVFDANRFRPELESMLGNALGRAVKVGGLRLSIFSGAVAADDITIADNPAFSQSPFVHAQSVKVGVELIPLIFSQAIHVTEISLDNPSITLIRSNSGTWNFSDLGNEDPMDESEPSNQDSQGLAGMDIIIRQLRITNGKVTIIRSGGAQKPATYSQVNLNVSNLSFISAFPFSLTAAIPGEGKLDLQGQAGPLNKTDVALTPMAAEIALKHLDLVSSGFVTPDSGIEGLVDLSGTLNSDGQQLRSKLTATADRLRLVKGGHPADRPISLEYVVNYDLIHNNGTISEAKIAHNEAIARLTGSFAIGNNSLTLKTKLQGIDMPVDDLTPLLPAFGVILPKEATLEGGVLNTDLETEGTIEKMVTTGTVEIANTRLAGFDLSGKIASLASLPGIDSTSVTEIKVFSSAIRLTPERIQVSSLLLIVPALGELSGSGTIDTDQSLDFKMRARLNVSGNLVRIAKGGKLDIPFFVRGPAENPKFAPDVHGIAGSLLESVLPGQDSAEKPSDSDQSLGDALRKLLRKK